MKTSRISRGFTLIELLVVITIIAIIAAIAIGNSHGAEPVPVQTPRTADTSTIIDPAERAEQRAAAAILKGNLSEAKGWSEVAFQLRAGKYLAPAGDVFKQFAAQVGKLKEFAVATIEVETVKPRQGWYTSVYNTQAAKAVFVDNSPEDLKLALARGQIFESVRESNSYSAREHANNEDIVAILDWIDNGCKGEPSTAVAKELVAKAKIEKAVALLTTLTLASK